MYKVYCDTYLIYDENIDDLKIFSPKVDLELNKVGSFTFSIYPNHPYFDKLKKLKSIIQVFDGNYLIFRGRILNDEQGFHNEKQVTCEGELAFLLDSRQRPYDFQSGDQHTTVADLFTFFITNHNAQVDADHRFNVGTITVTDPNNYIVRSDSTYLNTWDSINNKLIDSLGGYLFVRHEADGNYIDYLEDFNTLSTQTIEFGENLLSMKKIVKGEEIATAVIPLGAKLENSEQRLTIESVTTGGVDYVYNQAAVDLYGWIFTTVTFDDVTLASNLLTKGNAYLADIINLVVSLELDAADLSSIKTGINTFRMGTYIRVKSTPHSLNQTFLVKKLSINLTNPAGNKLTLGTSYKTFTEQTSGETKDYATLVNEVSKTESKVNIIIPQVEQQVTSMVSQSSGEILQIVSHNYYLKDETDTLVESVSTKLSQTEDTFEFQFNQFQQDIAAIQSGTDARFQDITKYIRFIDGNIILGQEANPLILKIQNDRISFLQNNFEVAYFSNNKLYVTDGEYTNSLKIGKFAFLPRANGNTSFKKVVD